jgi:hypothetical protein
MRVHQWIIAVLVIGLSLWGLNGIARQYATPLVSAQAGSSSDHMKPSTDDVDKTKEPATDASKEPETKPVDKEIVYSNPFDLTAKEGPRPKALMKEKYFYFGRMAKGGSGSHEFVLRNEGNAPLKVAKGPTMCKCTLSSLAGQEIAPCEEIKVSVTWAPLNLGTFGRTTPRIPGSNY